MENINNIILLPLANPFFVTGFSDGESCFHLAIGKNSKYKNGYYVNPGFSIVLHEKDKLLLEKIQEFFGGIGTLKNRKGNFIQWRVFSIKDLDKIIAHFDQYQLVTKKQVDYMLFKEALYLIKNKEHLTVEGFKKIILLRADMNKGLPESLKNHLALDPKYGVQFIPSTVTKPKFIAKIPEKLDPNWITGFTEAEGCFFVKIQKNKNSDNFQIKLGCQITQHNRDSILIKSLIPFFNCGRLETTRESYVSFVVTKLSNILQIIIPFFEKYPLNGSKAKDFEDWKKVAKLMESNLHLTKEGKQQILQLKSGMNFSRNN